MIKVVLHEDILNQEGILNISLTEGFSKIFILNYAVNFCDTDTVICKNYGRICQSDKLTIVNMFEENQTSTKLVMSYVHEHGIAKHGQLIIINDTDTDSVLAAAILKGILMPHEIFQKAAKASYSQETNYLSDKLKGIQSYKDPERSFKFLYSFANGREF